MQNSLCAFTSHSADAPHPDMQGSIHFPSMHWNESLHSWCIVQLISSVLLSLAVDIVLSFHFCLNLNYQ